MKIFTHHVAPQVALVALADFVAAAVSLYLAYIAVWQFGYALAVSPGFGLLRDAVLFATVVVLSLGAMGLYTVKHRHGTEDLLARIVVGVGVAAVGIAVLEFMFRFVESRPMWLLALPLCAMLLGTVRVLEHHLLDDDIFRRRVLVYGAGNRAARILQLRRKSDQRGFRVVGFVATPGDAVILQDSRVITRDICPLLEYVREQGVDEIVMAVDDRRRSFPISELLQCRMAGIRIVDLLEFLERETGRIKVDMVNPAWLIFSDGFGGIGSRDLRYTALDILGALFLAVLALPVGLMVALAILLDDGGPVVYRQRRVGRGGKEFTLLKFRSMKKDAEAGGAVRWAQREDDRVTRVGKWIRKLRLDELPQLVNVLKGDMSFVGPRPERPEFVEELARKIPYYHERHSVKPGLTGWAQLRYPYGASEEDSQAKLEYDMYYVKNRSMVFNLMIMLQTVEVVLWQKGAR